MDATLKPRDTRETCEVVKWAAAEHTPLEILGKHRSAPLAARSGRPRARSSGLKRR